MITIIERRTQTVTAASAANRVTLTTIGRRGPPGAPSATAISEDPGNILVVGTDGRLYVSSDRLDEIELLALAGL